MHFINKQNNIRRIDADDYVDNDYPNMYKNFKNKYRNYEKSEPVNPHMPYLEQDLKEIFNPSHNHFKENPDDFWVILMGMFAGARTNAAVTIKYKDIINLDGVYCVHFNKGDDKTDCISSEPVVLDSSYTVKKFVLDGNKATITANYKLPKPGNKTEDTEITIEISDFSGEGLAEGKTIYGIISLKENKVYTAYMKNIKVQD